MRTFLPCASIAAADKMPFRTAGRMRALLPMNSETNAGARMAPESGEPEQPSGLARGTNHSDYPATESGSAFDPNPSFTKNRGIEASDPVLTEDLALSLLKRPDLPAETLEQLGKNGEVLKFRKVKLALVEHPKTPRHISLPLVRQLYTFEVMQVALTPLVPADLKLAADEVLCNRLETISSGEKLTLAHRASGRVAGELLRDGEARVVHAALENPRLTEALVVRALTRPGASAALVEAVCHHAQWSLRREVRVALLRNEKTPMARAIEFARTMPAAQVREILLNSRLRGNVKTYLLTDLEKRTDRIDVRKRDR